jgi:hypothetical protein
MTLTANLQDHILRAYVVTGIVDFVGNLQLRSCRLGFCVELCFQTARHIAPQAD